MPNQLKLMFTKNVGSDLEMAQLSENRYKKAWFDCHRPPQELEVIQRRGLYLLETFEAGLLGYAPWVN